MKTPPGWFRTSVLLSACSLLPATHAATDRISAADSAFVRAQADSAVAWMPWGEAAFERAKTEQKPVFLAVGVFTSELTRAMARQTFSNADAGALMNANFVSVFVDAKERPEIAALYQHYLQNVKQLSGPPLNIWLTPELKPFEGANYLPPTEEWGKEGFLTASKRVAGAWKADATAQRRKADEAVETVIAAQSSAAPVAVETEEIARLLEQSAALWRGQFDPKHGGFGETPKHLEPELLRFLLADQATRDMPLATLQRLINGALRDPLDGGFFRYSVDGEWRQPYFQKLFMDQPRLALALLEASRVTGEARYAEAARGALHYALEHLALPDGDFVAAEDATTEESTAAYLWTLDEIRDVLGDSDAAEFSRLHGVTAAGNIPEDAFPGVDTKGKNILYRAAALPATGPEDSVKTAAAKLRQHRQKRAVPRRDDGSSSGAHGLMLSALTRVGAELKDARLAAAAKSEFAFIRDQLRAKDGGLLRLAGRATPATPADYALVMEGLLTYSAVTPDQKAHQLALDLLRAINASSWDSTASRYFVVPADAPGFWARVYSPAPSAGEPPAAEPAMLAALLANPTGDKAIGEQIESLIRAVAADVKNSGDAPRGDLLLALRLAQDHHR